MRLTFNEDIPVSVKQNPKHKKNADVGLKETVYARDIFIEQKDAVSFLVGEEVTCGSAYMTIMVDVGYTDHAYGLG